MLAAVALAVPAAIPVVPQVMAQQRGISLIRDAEIEALVRYVTESIQEPSSEADDS